MAVLTIETVLNGHVSESLISKADFDKMDNIKSLNGKPPAVTEGFSGNKISDSVASNTDKIRTSNHILSHSPNLYKQIGESMSEQGFIKLPRSLWNDPQWKSCRDKYKKVFMTILFHASYTEKTFCIDNHVISISPGQFCTSLRNLVELCNEGVSFKADKIDKNIVERSVSLFSKIGIVRQEVRHGKSILTITQTELYEHFKSQSETQSETKVRHKRDTNKESNNCSVCICSVCICEKKEEEKILEEHKKITKSHPDGNTFEMSKSDLFTLAIQQKTDWSAKEIDEIWEIFVKYSQPIRDVFKFCEGTIKNLRKIQAVKNINQEKSKCSYTNKYTNSAGTKASKTPCTTSNSKTTENVTLGRPLANWRSLINQPKQS